MTLLDITGRKYGRLTALRSVGKNKYGRTLWLCRCSCLEANEIVAVCGDLQSGHTKSCGCLQKEAIARSRQKNLKHGHARGYGTPEYQSWRSMIKRCTNPANDNWKSYGGRGITVCKRWRGEKGFEHFLADMGPRSKGTTLDRYPNKNGNYTPSNCRWATSKQQARHRRNTKLSPKKVRRIRQLAAAGVSQNKIRQKIGIDQTHVSQVVLRKIWNPTDAITKGKS